MTTHHFFFPSNLGLYCLYGHIG